MNKNIKKAFTVLSLSLMGAIALTGCGNPKAEVKEPTQEFYNIYNLAKDAGYEGSYDAWLNSIKGEKGDPGIGISDITFKEVKDNKTIFTVKFENGTLKEISIMNGKDGEQGKPGLPGEDLYTTFVNDCGYVGTKEDFLKDYASNRLGSKPNYKIKFGYKYTGTSKITYVDEYSFKNGQKVNYNFSKLSGDYSQILGIFEHGDLEHDEYFQKIPTKIDLNDYRAHDDTEIICLLAEKSIDLISDNMVPYDYNKIIHIGDISNGIKFKFQMKQKTNYNEYEKADITDSVINDLKGFVKNKLPADLKLTYDPVKKVVKADKPGEAELIILSNGKSITSKIRFLSDEDMNKKPDTNPYLQLDEFNKRELMAMEIGEFENLDIKKYRNFIDGYKLQLKHNSNIVELYDEVLYPVKAGTDVLQFINLKDNSVILEQDIKVYNKGEAPAPEMINDLDVRQQGGKFTVDRMLGFYINSRDDEYESYCRDYPTINITKQDGSKVNFDIVTNGNNDYNQIEVIPHEAGTFNVRIERNGHYYEKQMECIDERISFEITNNDNVSYNIYRRSYNGYKDEYEEIDYNKKYDKNEEFLMIINENIAEKDLYIYCETYDRPYIETINNKLVCHLSSYNVNDGCLNITISKTPIDHNYNK